MRSLDLLIGLTLDGKYALEKVIGHGGMGGVFLGVHQGTGRRVAVKVILPQLVRDAQAVERFRREARAAGTLRHPNVVDVTDFGVATVGGSETAYLVMEHLEGMTLRALLDEEKTLPLDTATDIADQIAVALREAHEHGIVHRDLKPENILLVPDARGGYAVKVIDFGIASLRQPHSGDGASASALAEPGAAAATAATEDVTATIAAGEQATLAATTPSTGERFTVAGMTLGTPAYMSPEQCRGDAVDARSDIYALGTVVFEMLAGRRPFVAANYQDLLRQLLHEPAPELKEVAPRRFPAPVSAVLARALAKDPAARFPTATGF